MPTETTATTRTNDKLTGNASVGTEFVPTLMEGCNILKFLHIQVSPHGTLKRNGHSLVRNSRTLAADLPEKSNLRMWQRLDRCCGAVLSVAADITRAVSSRRDNDPPKHETSRLMLLRMNAHRRANLENFLGTHDVVEGFGRPFGGEFLLEVPIHIFHPIRAPKHRFRQNTACSSFPFDPTQKNKNR